MKHILGIFLLLLFASSCLTPQEISDRKCLKAQRRYELSMYKYGCPWRTADTSSNTTTSTTTRDTTIYIRLPADTVYKHIKVPVPASVTTPVSRLETRFALSIAWIENSELHHELQQKQTDVPATIPGAIKTSTSTTTSTIRVPYPVDKPVRMPLRWWEKTFVWSGIIAWISIIAVTIFKLRRLLLAPGIFK